MVHIAPFYSFVPSDVVFMGAKTCGCCEYLVKKWGAWQMLVGFFNPYPANVENMVSS